MNNLKSAIAQRKNTPSTPEGMLAGFGTLFTDLSNQLEIIKAQFESDIADLKQRTDGSIADTLAAVEEAKNASESAKNSAVDIERYAAESARIVKAANDSFNFKVDELLRSAEQKSNAAVVKMEKSLSDFKKIVGTLRGPKGEVGYPGTPADDKAILKALTEKIPKIEQLSVQDIITMLETPKGNNRLDKSAIKGLDEYLDNIMRAFRESKSDKQIKGGGGGDSAYYYDLSPYLNGSTSTFTIPIHRKILQIVSSNAPVIFRPLIDYTHTRTTLTFDLTQITPSTQLISGQSTTIIYTR